MSWVVRREVRVNSRLGGPNYAGTVLEYLCQASVGIDSVGDVKVLIWARAGAAALQHGGEVVASSRSWP